MMDESHPDMTPSPIQPDVRLEMAGDGTRRVWSIYSDAAPPARPSSSPLPSGWDVTDILRILHQGRRAIILWVVFFLVLGMAYVQTATPIYNVVAQVLIVNRAVLSEQTQQLNIGASFLSTQAEIIRSDKVIEASIPSLSFVPGEELEIGPVARTIRDARASLVSFVASLLPFVDAESEEKVPDPVAVVSDALTASPILGTSVLSLSYIEASPERAVEVLGTIIETYQKFIRDIEESEHKQDFGVLVEREKELRDQLDTLNERYAAFHAESGVLGNGSPVQANLLQSLGDQLVAAKTLRINLENELAALDETGQRRLTRETSESREQLREALWRAEVRLAELGAKFNSAHPRILEAQQQVVALRFQLDRSEALERKTLEREKESALSTERRLAIAYQQELEKAKVIDGHRIRQIQIEAEVERVSQAHQSALAMLRDAQLTERGLEEGRAKVVTHVLQEPRLPEEAMWPRAPLILGPCIVLGLLFGIGTVLLQKLNVTEPLPVPLAMRPPERPETNMVLPRLPQALARSSKPGSAA